MYDDGTTSVPTSHCLRSNNHHGCQWTVHPCAALIWHVTHSDTTTFSVMPTSLVNMRLLLTAL